MEEDRGHKEEGQRYHAGQAAELGSAEDEGVKVKGARNGRKDAHGPQLEHEGQHQGQYPNLKGSQPEENRRRSRPH